MKTGELNRIVTISSLTEVTVNGDVTATWSGVDVRAKVTQVDGSRFFKDEELKDVATYKIECFDNSYPDNIKLIYNGVTLFPIRPITRNPGKSNLNELVIYASTKK